MSYYNMSKLDCSEKVLSTYFLACCTNWYSDYLFSEVIQVQLIKRFFLLVPWFSFPSFRRG